MNKLLFRILLLLFPFYINSQVFIGSITISPITGTNDIDLSIYSYCSQVHRLNNFEITNNTAETIVNLCYVDTGLLMPTNFTSHITLSNINTAGIQTLTVTAYYNYYLGPTQPCNANIISGTPTSLTFEAPLTQPRIFTLGNNTFEQEKVSLYPNPNKGTFSIDLPLKMNNVSLLIYDVTGKKIFGVVNYSSGTPIQINDISKGMYFIKVSTNKASEIIKFAVN
jgi:hypothetical protein